MEITNDDIEPVGWVEERPHKNESCPECKSKNITLWSRFKNHDEYEWKGNCKDCGVEFDDPHSDWWKR